LFIESRVHVESIDRLILCTFSDLVNKEDVVTKAATRRRDP